MNRETAALREVLRRQFDAAPGSLDDVTLLTYLLCFSLTYDRARETARHLLETFGHLEALFSADAGRLTDAGLSPVTAVLLRLVLTVPSVAAATVPPESLPPFDNVERLGQYLVRLFAGTPEEKLVMLLLDRDYRLTEAVTVNRGDVSSVTLRPREMAACAARKKAAYVVLAHNHPAGTTTPSRADYDATQTVCRAFEILEIPVLEHIVVSGASWRPILLAGGSACPFLPDSFYPREWLTSGVCRPEPFHF